MERKGVLYLQIRSLFSTIVTSEFESLPHPKQRSFVFEKSFENFQSCLLFAFQLRESKLLKWLAR